MPGGNGISGRSGDALIGTGGSPISVAEVRKWSWNPKGSNPAYRSNKTGGFTKRAPGYKDGGGSFDFVWDPTNPITAQVDVTQQITLNLQTTTGQRVVMPVIVDGIKLDVDIEGATIIGGSVDFSNDGAWTYATPTAGLMAPLPAPPGEGQQGVRAARTSPQARPAVRPAAARQDAAAAAAADPNLVSAVAEAVISILEARGYLSRPDDGGRVVARAA